MNIAIFHNFMDNIGGAEAVTLTLSRELNADIYTTNVDEDKIRRMGFDPAKVRSIGKVPLNAPFRQQMALWRFRRLKLKKPYDFFIIAGDWAMSAAVIHKPNLWYVHSPIREIWDLYDYTRANIVHPLKRPLFDLWVSYNRKLNISYTDHVERMACNSNNTSARVKKYLNREAAIVHPPVETSRYHCREHSNYWLSVNRLIGHKRVDLQIEAFRGMPEEKLIIVGSYEQSRHFRAYAEQIQKQRPSNVEVKSWVRSEELIELYARCKGFIATAADEDFGMTLVEAMASGKPVIAAKEGGYRETVTAETGVLIESITVDALRSEIQKMSALLKNDPDHYRRACVDRAKNFDTQIFIQNIKALLPK